MKLDALRMGGTSEHDLNLVKAEVASFEDDEKGWNVFHYAANHQSDAIMEKLVEFIGKQLVTVFACIDRFCV